jgi:hypothetical protein
MTVKKAPGADDEIVDLVHQQRGSPEANFSTTTIQDDDGSIADSTVINSQEDRAVVTLDVGAGDNVTTSDGNTSASQISALDEGDEATVETTTQAGGETTVTLDCARLEWVSGALILLDLGFYDSIGRAGKSNCCSRN